MRRLLAMAEQPKHGGRRAPGRLLSCERLYGRVEVFADRAAAGRELAELLATAAPMPDVALLAVPAGGVPIAVELARRFDWSLDVAVVSKITLPWNREAGYGAVAFDGSVLLNDGLICECSLSEAQVADGIAATRRKVARRVQRLRVGRGPLELGGRTALLVDDGLASGFTLRAAVAACRRVGAERVAVAVPTGHEAALARLRREVDLVACANVRGGVPFAVADAFERWADVPEAQAELMLERQASP